MGKERRCCSVKDDDQFSCWLREEEETITVIVTMIMIMIIIIWREKIINI